MILGLKGRERQWASAALAGLLLLAGSAVTARGEDKPDEKKRVLEVGKWYPGLEAGLTMTQSSYTDNWRGGDKGSVVWALIAQGDWRTRSRAG